MFENAIYGGRIDNDFDLRILRAHLESMFSVHVLQADKKISIGSTIPTSKSFKDHMIFVNKLSEFDIPR